MTTKEKTTLSLDPEIKREGTAVLHAMGLNLTTFVEMGLRQTINEGQLPFTPSLPTTPHSRSLSAKDAARRISELNASTPLAVRQALGDLKPEDERRILEERNAKGVS